MCRGLWLAAVCDLWAASRPLGWGTWISMGVTEAPASVWGAGVGGVHWGLLCAVAAMAEGGGLSDREADPPTHPHV